MLNNIDQNKIDLLISCGYTKELILRCAPDIQEEMYYHSHYKKFGFYPYKRPRYKVRHKENA